MYVRTNDMIIGTGLGEIPISPPIVAQWPFSDYPERVRLAGRFFRRSDFWTYPYDGVVAQYRQETDRNAAHLKVYRDGRAVVDHIDEANPDRGLVLEHTVEDVVPHLLDRFGNWVYENRKPLGWTAACVTLLAILGSKR